MSVTLLDIAFLATTEYPLLYPHFDRWLLNMPLADEHGADDFSVLLTGMPLIASGSENE